jgi:CheY-like chemotaxis protein
MPNSCRKASNLLGGSRYAVVEAADAREGISKAQFERPDLILMDRRGRLRGHPLVSAVQTRDISNRIRGVDPRSLCPLFLGKNLGGV